MSLAGKALPDPGIYSQNCCDAGAGEALEFLINGFHGTHISPEFFSDPFNAGGANGPIHPDKLDIVHPGIPHIQAFADDGGIEFFHESGKQGQGFVVEEITPIFGRV